jgi:TetR/AcrR family transcriptional regulator, transcriptional repressor for nem operon
MRVSRQKASENRERIIDAAGALFREKGFEGIGVADIMKAAQLTHGGFYGHFVSKDDLIVQASERAMALSAMNWTEVTAGAPKNPYAALLNHYLSPRHRDDRGHGCAFAALGGDAARCGKPVQSAFARGLEPLIEIIAEAIPGRSKSRRRRKALAALSELVGALMLARAVGEPALSNEILDAAKQELLAAANC